MEQEQQFNDDAQSIDSPAPHPTRPRIFAVTNQKGGVGKTTLAINVAAAFAEKGARVLVIDLDPQANSTSGVGIEVGDGPTVYNLFLATRTDVRNTIRETSLQGLHIIPATAALRGADPILGQQIGSEQILKEALDRVSGYDYIFIDCPPALNRLTLNALTAATHVIVPVQLSGKWPLDGTTQLLEAIELVRGRLNPTLELLGVVPTFYSAKVKLGEAILAKLSDQFGELLFNTRIKHTPKIGEASIAEKPVVVYAKTSKAADNFRALAAEMETRL